MVLANIDKDKEDMNNKVSEFEDKYIAMERLKNTTEQKYEMIKTELDVNQGQLKEVLAQLGSVQMELFASKAEVAKLISLDGLLHDANKTINDKQEMIEHQRNKIQECEDEIARLKLVYSHQEKQYDFLVDSISKEKAEKMSLQNVVSDLAFQLKDSQIKVVELEGTVSSQSEKIDELHVKSAEKDKKIADFQDKLKLAIRHIENLKAKNESVNRQKECFNMLVEDMEEHMRYDSELLGNTSKYCEFLEDQVLNLRKKVPQTLDNNHTNVFRSRYDKSTPPQQNSISKNKSNNSMKKNDSSVIASIPSGNSISVNSKNMSRDIVSITNLLNDDDSNEELNTIPNEEYTEQNDYFEGDNDDAFTFDDSNIDNGYIKINPMFDSLTPQAETDHMFERMGQLEERLTSMLQTFEEKLVSSQSTAPIGIVSDVLSVSIEHAGRKHLEYLEKSLKIMERRINTYNDGLTWQRGEIERKLRDIKALDKSIYLDHKEQQSRWIASFTETNKRQPSKDEITKDFALSNTSLHVSNLQKLFGDLISTILKAKQKKNSIDFLETKITKVNGALLYLSKNESVDSTAYWESLGLGSLEEILEEDSNNDQPMWLPDVTADKINVSSIVSSQQDYINQGLREINVTPCTFHYMQTLFGVTTEMPEILKYIENIQEKKKKLLDTTESIISKEERLQKVKNKRELSLQELENWKNDFNKILGHDPDDDEKISSRPYQLIFLGFTEAENKIEAMNNDIENSYNELKDLVRETNDVINQLYELTYEKQEEVNVEYYLDIIESRKT